MKKLFILFLLIPFFLPAAFTATGTDGVVTQIGATHSWYLVNHQFPVGPNYIKANKVYFDILYTVGDETSVAFNIGYLYGDVTPAVANISYFPESDSSGQLSIMSRTMLKSTGTRRYTISCEVPDRVTYVVITFAATGGTPTGTIVINGYICQFN